MGWELPPTQTLGQREIVISMHCMVMVNLDGEIHVGKGHVMMVGKIIKTGGHVMIVGEIIKQEEVKC